MTFKGFFQPKLFYDSVIIMDQMACSSLLPPEDLVYCCCFCSILMLSNTQCSSTMIYSVMWEQEDRDL